MANLVVRQCDGSHDVIKDCEQKMAAFCTMDPSYIEYDVDGRLHNPNNITAHQVDAMNRALQTRSPVKVWENHGLLVESLEELKAIDTDWDLIAMSDEEWDTNVKGKLAKLYQRVMRANIGASSGTKVLHLMRPRLVAIADSVVVNYLGVPTQHHVECALILAGEVRRIGRDEDNASTLAKVRQHLIKASVIESNVVPSACRIIDALLWMRANGLKRPEKAGYHRLWRQMRLASP